MALIPMSGTSNVRSSASLAWEMEPTSISRSTRRIVMKVSLILHRLRCAVIDESAEYTDDTEIIPKDSTVLARRLPASAPGKGRAARYVSGKPPVSAKPSAAAIASRPVKTMAMDKAMTEEERLKAMLQFTDAQWQQKQEEMSHETRVHIQGKTFNKKANVPEGEPPHGYICYRCGKKGKQSLLVAVNQAQH
jgi:protein MPE1